MTDLPETALASQFHAGHPTDSGDRDTVTTASEEKAVSTRSSKASLWSIFLANNFFLFETHPCSSSGEKKEPKPRNYAWASAVRKVVSGGSMRRLQERILGTNRADVSSSTSQVWLLGTCYKVSPEESSNGANSNNGLDAFLQDFSSRIWMTYRKGFVAIGDSKYTSDVGWGCMIRSSQMLVAQALLFHILGRPWRKPLQKPYDPEYVKILRLFGDSDACPFSIHNLLQAGLNYGLIAGQWLGPYAMCRTWETLNRANREQADNNGGKETLPMAIYIVSGDEDGERGGAPVLCIDYAARLCYDFGSGQLSWAPILLLVPLVLGLEKVNPRYIPLLWETFTFPQSLGILGGKPGASTYLVGVQDDKVLYLDPHDVHPVVDIKIDNLEADTSTYHCSTVRHLPLDQIDPSLAIGFYCRDKDDFEDFCSHASELADRSSGAPLFTVVQSLKLTRPARCDDCLAEWSAGDDRNGMDDTFGLDHLSDCDAHAGEDDWQIL